ARRAEPTCAEAGLPGADATNWWGILAPVGTPAAVVERLQHDIAAILDSAGTRKRLELEGAEPLRMGGAEFGQFMSAETAKWTRVVRRSEERRVGKEERGGGGPRSY